MNLVESLGKASTFLARNGVRSPRLNAELLLCHTLGAERIELYTCFDRELAPGEADSYRELLVKRARGCPLQYITGTTGFMGLALDVREGVFIPRPETEVLVERALEVIPEEAADVLDIGTGCGNIAVSVAAARANARVTAVDVNPAAVELCARNARKHGVAERVTAVRGDLFDVPVGYMPPAFDVIVANPPYVPLPEMDGLDAEVRDYEPREAVFSGEDGFEVTGRIIAGAQGCLRRGGWLVIEVDERAADRAAGALSSEGWREVEVFSDLNGRPRVVRAVHEDSDRGG